jgi:uncharacterized protein YcbX
MSSDTKLGRVSALHRYPVKSMAGEGVDEVDLGVCGLPGDRAWAVRDEVRGGIRGAKKIPALMQLAARYPEPPAALGSSPAEIELPDGAGWIRTDDARVNERLSEVLAHSVTLWPLVPREQLDHYRRGAPTYTDMQQELRSIFGRLPDEPLPDLSGLPRELFTFESPPGTYFDAYPLHLLSEASLAGLQASAPQSRIDARRFRPNVVIDETPDLPFPELGWAGKRVRLGEAVLRFTIPCMRCVMTTHGFADLPRDPGVMRSLVRATQGHLGVYAAVESPGRVKRGDLLTLLD